MKSMMAVLLTSLVLMSCGFKENPLDGKGIEMAVPREDLQTKPGRVSGVVIIDAVPKKNFIENQAERIQISVRGLTDEFDKIKEVIIENLASFPGATFDSATGTFEWKPPLGTTRDQYIRGFILNVRGVVRSDKVEGRWDTAEFPIEINVYKNPQEPIIQSVTGIAGRVLREGSQERISVEVHDPDGASDAPPTLEILSVEEKDISLAPFLSLTDVKEDTALKKWTFTYIVDLGDAELTATQASAGVAFQARGRYGKISKLTEVSTQVLTLLKAPETSWKSHTEIAFDRDNKVKFIIYDPKGESKMTYQVSGLPLGAFLTCDEEDVLVCTLDWKPAGDPRDFPKEGRFNIEVTSANKYTGDTRTLVTKLTLIYSGVIPKEVTP